MVCPFVFQAIIYHLLMIPKFTNRSVHYMTRIHFRMAFDNELNEIRKTIGEMTHGCMNRFLHDMSLSLQPHSF